MSISVFILAIFGVAAAMYSTYLLRRLKETQTQLVRSQAGHRHESLVNTMNRMADKVENFRVNNNGQLPRSIFEVMSMFSKDYLEFNDPDSGQRIECHQDTGGKACRGKLNFSYLPDRSEGVERVDLQYFDQQGRRWYTRAIFANGPKYEFI